MFRLNVLQNQWIILALAGGLALLLGLVLAYRALWKQRGDLVSAERVGQASRQRTAGPWLRTFMPWFLLVTYISALLFAVIYTLVMGYNPPNW